jgi:hypothetical protein
MAKFNQSFGTALTFRAIFIYLLNNYAFGHLQMQMKDILYQMSSLRLYYTSHSCYQGNWQKVKLCSLPWQDSVISKVLF